MIDSIVIDELILGAEKSYLRFSADEWYFYQKGAIKFIEDSDWLEAEYRNQCLN